MDRTITKSVWLAGLQCPGMAWRASRAERSVPSEAEQFRMRQGQEVGVLARELFPSGVLVSGDPVETTRQLLSQVTNHTLFEAAFARGPFVAKADIVTRSAGGWHVLEVKSNFADTTSMRDLVDDLAYTVMVARGAGLVVNNASLVLLSRGFRFGRRAEDLFEIIDKTNEVMSRAAEFDTTADSLAHLLSSDTPPSPVLSSACRVCPCFGDECLGLGLAHTVLELPNLHHTKLKRLSAAGIVDLASVPDSLILNDRQRRAKASALSGQPVIEAGLRDALNGIVWPCCYLDFETVATTLPLYPGHGCHQQVLTQFSLHRRESADGELTHAEFLADASADCQRELAERLIADLGSSGSIVVYTMFEQKRLETLQAQFADLTRPLQAIVDRLVDLHPLIADHVYHPEFRGSYSIKKVLPALVPSLSYSGLPISDGDTALTRFARMARGEIANEEAALTRRQLLDYCRLDTFAMVQLRDALIRLAG